MEQEEHWGDEVEPKKNPFKNVNKALAILFVGAIYLVIFLKILFIN